MKPDFITRDIVSKGPGNLELILEYNWGRAFRIKLVLCVKLVKILITDVVHSKLYPIFREPVLQRVWIEMRVVFV